MCGPVLNSEEDSCRAIVQVCEVEIALGDLCFGVFLHIEIVYGALRWSIRQRILDFEVSGDRRTISQVDNANFILDVNDGLVGWIRRVLDNVGIDFSLGPSGNGNATLCHSADTR
ncbi:hypothetical protein D3C86_1336790 [compost metagenome]